MDIFSKSKNFIFVGVVLFLSWFSLSFANFEITEIMYDLDGADASREWIEVKNTGNQTEDLSKWFFFSDNTKHKLNPIGDFNVPVGEYVVITENNLNFKNDWPNYQGFVFDSSWTDFNNKDESISLINPNLETISPVSFSSSLGGAGNSGSLQKIDGVWQELKPTPGAENKLVKITTTPTKDNSIETSSFNEGSKENIIRQEKTESSSEIINLNDLGQNQKVENEIWKIDKSIFPWVGLVVLIILGGMTIVLVNNNQHQNILEKGLTAEDIKIIE